MSEQIKIYQVARRFDNHPLEVHEVNAVETPTMIRVRDADKAWVFHFLTNLEKGSVHRDRQSAINAHIENLASGILHLRQKIKDRQKELEESKKLT